MLTIMQTTKNRHTFNVLWYQNSNIRPDTTVKNNRNPQILSTKFNKFTMFSGRHSCRFYRLLSPISFVPALQKRMLLKDLFDVFLAFFFEGENTFFFNHRLQVFRIMRFYVSFFIRKKNGKKY